MQDWAGLLADDCTGIKDPEQDGEMFKFLLEQAEEKLNCGCQVCRAHDFLEGIVLHVNIYILTNYITTTVASCSASRPGLLVSVFLLHGNCHGQPRQQRSRPLFI